MTVYAIPRTNAPRKITIPMIPMGIPMIPPCNVANLWYGQMLQEQKRNSLLEHKWMKDIPFTRIHKMDNISGGCGTVKLVTGQLISKLQIKMNVVADH